MKESKSSLPNIKVKGVNSRPMTPDQQLRFEAAIDALLADWIRLLDSRQSRGISDERHTEK